MGSSGLGDNRIIKANSEAENLGGWKSPYQSEADAVDQAHRRKGQ